VATKVRSMVVFLVCKHLSELELNTSANMGALKEGGGIYIKG
jgi:hypothetical protein